MPDGGAVGALADDELDGAEDYGLACAGFTREDVEAWMQIQGEVWY